MQKLSSLSVFFPCYNEEKNIALMIEDFLHVLPHVASTYEIIVVDDGSTDQTKKIVQQLEKQHSTVRLVSHKENKGYGAALRTGFSAAQYDWTFWTDGDKQFNLQQLLEFIPFCSQYKAIIGYRKKRAEGWKRSLNADLYRLFINLLFRIHIRDIDCAFKLIRTDVLKSAPLTSTGAFTSAELLYRLRKMKIAIKELPVDHFPRTFGTPTGNHPRVILRALKEALELRAKTIFSQFAQ